MATYFFDLLTGTGRVPDPLGTELNDDEAARTHASTVARELMRHREGKSRHWRLSVRRDGTEPGFEVLFATVDQTMDALDSNIRQSVERVSGNIANLSDAIGDLRLTLWQVKATMAKADDKIHLAAIHGVRL